MADTSTPTVTNDTAARRFEVSTDDGAAELTYRVDGDRLKLNHTGVPDSVEGRGIGGALVRAAVDFAVDEGLTVVPNCTFAEGWLRRHEDIAARVTIEWPR